MKLKDIPGVMLGKNKALIPEWIKENIFIKGYNQALALQGEVEVEVDVYKIFNIITELNSRANCKDRPCDTCDMVIAQALSDNLPSILKVKK